VHYSNLFKSMPPRARAVGRRGGSPIGAARLINRAVSRTYMPRAAASKPRDRSKTIVHTEVISAQDKSIVKGYLRGKDHSAPLRIVRHANGRICRGDPSRRVSIGPLAVSRDLLICMRIPGEIRRIATIRSRPALRPVYGRSELLSTTAAPLNASTGTCNGTHRSALYIIVI